MISHISIVNFFRVEVLFVKVLDCQNVAIVDAPRMKLIFLARDNFLKMMFYSNFFNNQYLFIRKVTTSRHIKGNSF